MNEYLQLLENMDDDEIKAKLAMIKKYIPR